MKRNERNRNPESERLLHLLAVLFNLSVMAMTAFIGWSVYSAIVKSEEIYTLLKGDLLP